ncbi:hypothetical protein B0T26DRAFT_682642 [Lasiosphaeria miniovina]|uniref:Uncharacterized protein n=1 Tax=Lasiosphaeria miniovina TaxID=1954250 RepID=A0AA40BF30_9PEZI|nr:uncharacterized protein B0T26DRAFT_682642 [Lasiosphaeria miniovina]KAK0733029.1 hypothetical protein B0T26DRAFT_682642 [Lasiosphaeria miniovina]
MAAGGGRTDRISTAVAQFLALLQPMFAKTLARGRSSPDGPRLRDGTVWGAMLHEQHCNRRGNHSVRETTARGLVVLVIVFPIARVGIRTR